MRCVADASTPRLDKASSSVGMLITACANVSLNLTLLTSSTACTHTLTDRHRANRSTPHASGLPCQAGKNTSNHIAWSASSRITANLRNGLLSSQRQRGLCTSARVRQQQQQQQRDLGIGGNGLDELRSTDPIPYSELVVGCPTEVLPGEKRVALTPQNVALLLKKGFKRVFIESDAGERAQFPRKQYEDAGATIVNSADVWKADIILKVRPPRLELPAPSSPGIIDEAQSFGNRRNNFVDGFRPGSTMISFMYPSLDRSKPLIDTCVKKGINAFAMDMIPRISRAQTFDALSSMANIAGYKAVLEASNVFGRYMTGQTTAAGKIPPVKVLVIGAGVAGLSAIATVSYRGSARRFRCYTSAEIFPICSRPVAWELSSEHSIRAQPCASRSSLLEQSSSRWT